MLRSFFIFSLAAVTGIGLFANTATQAVPRVRNDPWLQRHLNFVEIARATQECKILFIGDSITDAWRRSDKGLALWNRHYAPHHAINFGISGDRTQHLLWRLQNGEIGTLRPKVVVMMIGTNNIGFESDRVTPRNHTSEIAAGIGTIVRYLQQELLETKILLLAIFPRGEKESAFRTQVGEVNRLIAPLHDGEKVFFLDIGPSFLEADGTLSREVMPDLLHPNSRGYQIWAEAMQPTLTRLLGIK